MSRGKYRRQPRFGLGMIPEVEDALRAVDWRDGGPWRRIEADSTSSDRAERSVEVLSAASSMIYWPQRVIRTEGEYGDMSAIHEASRPVR